MREYNTVDDHVAIVFADSFYRALFSGRKHRQGNVGEPCQTVREAFEDAQFCSMTDERVRKWVFLKYQEAPLKYLNDRPPFILLSRADADSFVSIETYLSRVEVGSGPGRVQPPFQYSLIPPGLPAVQDNILSRSKETYAILKLLNQHLPLPQGEFNPALEKYRVMARLRLLSLIGPKKCGKSQLALLVPLFL